jgi:hypothetical protein
MMESKLDDIDLGPEPRLRVLSATAIVLRYAMVPPGETAHAPSIRWRRTLIWMGVNCRGRGPLFEAPVLRDREWLIDDCPNVITGTRKCND